MKMVYHMPDGRSTEFEDDICLCCGKEVNQDFPFCTECGEPLTTRVVDFCESCSEPVFLDEVDTTKGDMVCNPCKEVKHGKA